MNTILSVIMIGLLSQVGVNEAQPGKDGVVRVQVEGTLGSVTLEEKSGANAVASVLAGKGEFVLDLRTCLDGQKRLNAYARRIRGAAYLVPAKVKVSGRLEFRPKQVVSLEKENSEVDTVSDRFTLVVVVDSLSLVEPVRE